MESFLGSLIVVGAIIFILIYVSLLIHTIKTPFQDEGKTKDDVSLSWSIVPSNIFKKNDKLFVFDYTNIRGHAMMVMFSVLFETSASRVDEWRKKFKK